MARWLLVAALLLGLLRFVRLGEWSLWLDEALMLADSLHTKGGGLENPLGYALFRLFLGFLDHRPGELELRLLPAIFGYLGIPLCYWAFAPFAGKRVAAGAALLLATSSWHTYWSQMARAYTLTQDLSLIGGGLFLRGLWRESTARMLLGLAVAGAACLAHLSGAFLLPALVAVPFALGLVGIEVPGARSRGGKLIFALGAIGLLASTPRIAEVWRAWHIIKGGGSPVHFLLTAGFFITPLLGTGVVIGSARAFLGRRPFEVLAVGLVAVVLAEGAAASFAVRVSAQYVFVLLPWIALVAALPLAATEDGGAERRSWFPFGYLALLALPALTTVGLYLSVRHGERPMWREAYRYVHDHKLPGDLILGMDAPVGEYYLSAGRTDLRNQFELAYLDRFRSDVAARWARYERRTWFVLNREQLADWDDEDAARFEGMLARSCRLVASFPLQVESRDLSVQVYLRE